MNPNCSQNASLLRPLDNPSALRHSFYESPSSSRLGRDKSINYLDIR